MLLAAFSVSLPHAVQVWGIPGTSGGKEVLPGPSGLALFRYAGVVPHHEILFAGPYRLSIPSKRLELGIAIMSALRAYSTARQVILSAAPAERSGAFD